LLQGDEKSELIKIRNGDPPFPLLSLYLQQDQALERMATAYREFLANESIAEDYSLDSSLQVEAAIDGAMEAVRVKRSARVSERNDSSQDTVTDDVSMLAEQYQSFETEINLVGVSVSIEASDFESTVSRFANVVDRWVLQHARVQLPLNE
jgi:hypothetical protein